MTRSILQQIFGRTAQPSSTRSRAPWKVAAAAIGLALGAASATADIVATTPAFVELDPPPPSVVLGALQSNVDLFAFDEKQCFRLNTNLQTDQGFIPAHTLMSSHFLHGDPFNNLLLDGRVRFDDVIIGVISTTAGLDASDASCGLPPAITVYPTGIEPFRGLEAGQPDAYQILGGGFVIQARMDVPVNSYSDQIRVLTRCQCDGTQCPGD
jgi:hypothetical protein